MYFLSILLGLITGCEVAIVLVRVTSISKIILGGFLLEVSMIILLAEVFDLLHISAGDSSYVPAFFALAMVSSVVAFRIKPKLSVNGKEIAIMVIVLMIALVFFHFTFPSPLPSSDAVDTAGHYLMAENILETGQLTGPTTWYNKLVPALGYANYPYGYHVTAALISASIGQPLIFELQPFAELLVAVTILMTILISLESTRCRNWAAAPLIVLAVMSTYTFDILTSGYYSQLTGIVLTVGFVWFLTSPVQNELRSWGLLSLVEAAIWLTYPYLALIPLAILIIQLLYFRDKTLSLRFVYVLTISSTLALPRLFWFLQMALGYYLPASGATLPLRNLLPLATVGGLGLVLFLASARRKKLDLTELAAPTLVTAALLQTFGLYIVDAVQHYASYFLSKSGYLASFSLIAMSGQLFKEVGHPTSSFTRKLLLGLILLVLISGNVFFGVYVNSRAIERTRALSLTIPIYDAAIWIRNNVPNNVSIWTIAASPIPLWVFAISHHPLPQKELTPLLSKTEWLKQAIGGSMLLIVTEPELSKDWFTSNGTLDLTNFTVMFHEVNAYVVIFNGAYNQDNGSASLALQSATSQPTASHSIGVSEYPYRFSLTTVIIVNRIIPVNNESKPMSPDAIETSARFVITRP